MKLFAKNKFNNRPQPALFLDRDGVINIDKGYVHLIKYFDFFQDIFRIIRSANKMNYLVIIVTNQAGIGRGYYSISQFEEVTNWMIKKLDEKDAKIDGLYFSPFHPKNGIGKFLKNEDTRKPGSGMFLEACQDFKIDIDNSIMVGDKISDLVASSSFGIKKNYLFNSSKKSYQNKKNVFFKELDSLLSIEDFILDFHQ